MFWFLTHIFIKSFDQGTEEMAQWIRTCLFLQRSLVQFLAPICQFYFCQIHQFDEVIFMKKEYHYLLQSIKITTDREIMSCLTNLTIFTKKYIFKDHVFFNFNSNLTAESSLWMINIRVVILEFSSESWTFDIFNTKIHIFYLSVTPSLRIKKATVQTKYLT